MITNPKSITWEKPTTKEDGSPLDYDVDYELGVAEVGKNGDPDGPVTPIMTIAGELQPDGTYKAPISEASLKSGVEYKIELQAFAHTDPTVASTWAVAADTIIFMSPPSPPTNFTVA